MRRVSRGRYETKAMVSREMTVGFLRMIRLALLAMHYALRRYVGYNRRIAPKGFISYGTIRFAIAPFA